MTSGFLTVEVETANAHIRDLEARLDDEQNTTALLIARLSEETHNVLNSMVELCKSEDATRQAGDDAESYP